MLEGGILGLGSRPRLLGIWRVSLPANMPDPTSRGILGTQFRAEILGPFVTNRYGANVSTYRIIQVDSGHIEVQKKKLWWWDTYGRYNLNQQEAAGEAIKAFISADAFRPKVLSIWSEKKPNGDKG